MLTAINSGDTAWVLLCTILVFLSLLGVTFFYGGLSQHRNPLPWLTSCMMVASLALLQWVLIGYTLSFGPDHNGWIGTWGWAALRGVGPDPSLEYAGTIPHLAFMIFRGMSAALAPLLFLAPYAERLRMRSVVFITLAWSVLVYDPVAHWILGVGGFLRTSGVVDFAGSAPLFITPAMATLAMMTFFRPPKEDEEPVSSDRKEWNGLLPAGEILLWMGGFGLSAGSALAANDSAAHAFVMTLIAAVSGALIWLLLDGLFRQQLTPGGVMTGGIAGLAAVLSIAGSAPLWMSIGLGILSALSGYVILIFLRRKCGRDNAHYVLGLLGLGSLWGFFAAGFSGSSGSCLLQLKAFTAIGLYSFGMSWLLFKGTEVLVGLHRPEAS